MAKLLDLFYKEFYLKLVEWRDPCVNDFFLLGSFWKPCAIIGFYLYFVLNLGPKLMKNRKPFKLEYVLIIYNTIQVGVCFIAGMLMLCRFFEFYDTWHCIEIDYNFNNHLYEAKLAYCFYLLKISDLLDTVFFVLRKKDKQITFLHVYHHSSMIIAGYVAAQYLTSGHLGFVGVINTNVHWIMYFYYLYTSIYPKSKNIIWWKKYVTLIQIIQFLLIISFIALPFFHSDCKYPRTLLSFVWVQNFFMLIMFSDFYIKTYVKKSNNINKINNNKLFYDCNKRKIQP